VVVILGDASQDLKKNNIDWKIDTHISTVVYFELMDNELDIRLVLIRFLKKTTRSMILMVGIYI